MHDRMQIYLLFMGGAFLLLMGMLSALLLWKMAKNEINLATLLNESNGDASISRFQLLLFSLVVAVGLFLSMLNQPHLAGYSEQHPGVVGHQREHLCGR